MCSLDDGKMVIKMRQGVDGILEIRRELLDEWLCYFPYFVRLPSQVNHILFQE
jgi:hypothetical protein